MAKQVELRGVVGIDITARGVSEELAKLNGADVEFHVNSPGGLFFTGVEIYNLFRGYAGRIEVLITGMAASAASYFILPAAKITAYDNATYMIHNARNLAIGDRHVMLKMHSILDGMDNIMANAYVKKNDASKSKIKSLMDAETFYFGDDIKAAGFVDEVIEAPDDANANDKDTALVEARALVEGCFDTLRDSAAANADIEKAVAYFDGMSALMDKAEIVTTKDGITTVAIDVTKPSATTTNALTPAGAGINKQEVKHMSLEVLLADPANASAKAEFDIAIGKARTEGKTAAKDEMKAVIEKVSPQLTSAAYDADVKDAGIKAITGEGHISTFETLVVIADRDIEKVKAAAAQAGIDAGGDGNGGLETPPQTAGADADDAVAYAEKQARLKGKGL